MLEFRQNRAIQDADGLRGVRHETRFVDPATLFLSLKQNAAKALLVVACFCALGFGYVLTATPLYTATSEILVDTRLAHADDGEGGNRSLAELGMDAMSIDSQVSILTSQKLAIAVLKRLHLENDDEFATPTTLSGAMLASLRRVLGSNQPDLRDGIPADLLEGFMKAVGVTRVQQTYVIKVSFTARNPRNAAIIANALVSTYSDAEIRSRMRARQISDRYVQTRLNEVREKIRVANQALSQAQNDDGTKDPNDARRALASLQATYAALTSQADNALQHQITPITAVSVLAEARPPTHRSQPNTLLVLLVSALAGGACVIGLTTHGELTDAAYRLPGQVEMALRLRCVGLFPKTLESKAQVRRLGSVRPGAGNSPLAPRDRRSPQVDDTLRAMKIAADLCTHNDDLAVIGIVSAVGGEGRSSIATAFADVVARTGQRSLLVDADFRQPALSRAHAPRSRAGLDDVLKDRATLDDTIVVRGDDRADFLPARAHDDAGGAAMLHIKGLHALIKEAAPRYDFLILDLPPLGAFTEAAALAPAIGAFFLVVEWGVTARGTVDAVIGDTPLLTDRIAGFVFNKVDVDVFRKRARGSKDAVHIGRPRTNARFS